ncbi:hypothetical protein [Nitrobacter sp. JJSN]|uniref:hypothetical protein n=1 Tax=Nitrobacter sp. JJSN TaxID=3453033 RepID=UPI003F7644E1
MATARTFFRTPNFALMAALILSLTSATGYAVSIHAGTDPRLQDLADNAALAGVNSLAMNVDQPADARSAGAIAAARTVIASQPGVVQRLQPSVEGLTMSVVVEDADKGLRASATAKYIPAKDNRSVQRAVHPQGYTAAAL